MDTKSAPADRSGPTRVHEVEVVMQAFAGIRPQEGAMRLLVVPGLVGVAGFHRRDDMHQAGMGARAPQAPWRRRPPCGCGSWRCARWQCQRHRPTRRRVRAPITKRFGKSRIIKDLDLPRRKKPRHSPRIAGPRQRAGDDNPVVAGEYPGEALAVTLRQALPQPPLPLLHVSRLYLILFGSGFAGLGGGRASTGSSLRRWRGARRYT